MKNKIKNLGFVIFFVLIYLHAFFAAKLLTMMKRLLVKAEEKESPGGNRNHGNKKK